MTLSHPFDRLTARAVLVSSLVGMVPGLGLVWLWRGNFDAARSVGGAVLYAGAALVVLFVARARGVDLKRILGRPLLPREALLAAGLGFLVLVFSFGTMLALLGALSLAFPSILEHYAERSIDFLVHRGGRLDLVSTALLAVTAAVIAPVVEELVFRGFLLTRWARRFGVRSGLVSTALLFGVLHFALAPLGATALGLVAGVLYLRTRSLVAPILAHATANSTIVLATILGDRVSEASAAPPGADELRGLLGLGSGLVLVSTPALVFALRRLWPAPDMPTPYDALAPEPAEPEVPAE